MYKNTLEVDPKGPIRVPQVITNTESVLTDLVWVDERTVQFVTKPQDLISDEDDGVST
jgi:hypothetical protein